MRQDDGDPAAIPPITDPLQVFLMPPLMKSALLFACAIAACLALSCTTFMRDEQADDLMKLDKAGAVMRKSVTRDDYKLEQGQPVRLHLLLTDNSIRVYAYPAAVDFLKSNRILILHMFEDDFKDGVFDRKIFIDKLGETVSIDK